MKFACELMLLLFLFVISCAFQIWSVIFRFFLIVVSFFVIRFTHKTKKKLILSHTHIAANKSTNKSTM